MDPVNQSNDTDHSHVRREVPQFKKEDSLNQPPAQPKLGPTNENEAYIHEPPNVQSEAEGTNNLKGWKALMVNQIDLLAVKISQGNFLAVSADVQSILRQLEPTKTLPLNTDGHRELGISLLESLSNTILFHLRTLHLNREYLDIACSFAQEALAFLPPNYSETVDWIFNAAKCFEFRFQLTGALNDIEAAIVGFSTVLKNTPLGHPKQLTRIESLGAAYQRRWSRLFNNDDLNNAMQYYSLALSLTPEGSPMIPHLHTKMAELFFLWSQADKNREVEGLEKAIETQKTAVNLTAEGDERLPGYLQRLGRSYYLKFQRLGKEVDINSAIDAQTRALQLMHQMNPTKLDVLHALGDSYQARFARLGSLEDCNNAIRIHNEVISFTLEGAPNMATYIASLGNSHMERFSQAGDLDDLDKAIEHQSRAISLTPQGDQNLPGRLNNLGISYKYRYHHLGKLEDIDKAIELQGSAGRLDVEAGRERAALLGNLGDSFQARYSHLRNRSDIELAISFQTKATEATPDDHPTKSGQLDSLGSSYQLRFQTESKSRNLADINKAIEYKTHAVNMAPEGHPKLATFLNNVGIAYSIRFRDQDQPEDDDLDQAIKYVGRAVALTPDGHNQKPHWLNNLGDAYTDRYRVNGQLQDFSYAVEALSQAISLTEEENINLPIILTNMAFLYYHRFKQSGTQDALDNSIQYLQKSIKYPHRHPILTFTTARFLGYFLSSNNRPGSTGAYQIAMDYLPRIIWLGNHAADRFSLISWLNNLVEEAAAAAIDVQDTHLALEWLEQGRSIVWSQVLQLRTPLDDLATVNPELAAELKQTSAELQNASAGINTPQSFEPGSSIRPIDWPIQSHHRVADRYDKLLDQVRQIPGFETFLRPKKAPALLEAARSQPIVVINVHQSRCDGLVLLPNKKDIIHVPLPNLYDRKALKLHTPFELGSRSSENSDQFEGFRGIRPRVAKDQFESMLGELWVGVARPILEALGIPTNKPPKELVHIIWCTTGPLSLLPLHAAGDYTTPRMRLFEFAISSYTPMLEILLRINQPSPTHFRILAVGQEQTPGYAPLPGTKQELECIKAHAKAPAEYTQIDGHNATPSAVFSAMEESDWVHLACHAYQHPRGPLGSSFRLYEGDLELGQIIQKNFKNKGLAFLSACQTATGNEIISNESAHLASGMLVAGYPSVIATMWAIADADAPLVADRVYAQLIKDGKMDYKESAKALHVAVGELRAKVGEKEFKRWAPFIHFGS